MTIRLRDLRMSFIWTETFADLLENLNTQPLSFLGRAYTYEGEIERLLGDPKATVGPGLTLPWPGGSGARHQGFWRHYFHGQAPPNARLCWQQLVPLRGRLPMETPGWLEGRVMVEGFFYPHGVALVLTATYQGEEISLEEAMKLARKIRKTGQFEMSLGEEAARPAGLKTLADSALDRLREMALGAGAPPGTRSREPFSIVTVVQGSGFDFDEPVKGSEVHRFLEVTSSWTDRWRNPFLPPIEGVRLELGICAEGDILYARKRGRAVWFPQQFSEEGGQMHSLSCYHRNLMVASMTVESLTGLVAETMRMRQSGRSLSSDLRACARHAARILGQLYGGAESTYGNASLLRQIDENDYQGPINALRRYFNMTEMVARE
jgi:hypothetical protein